MKAHSPNGTVEERIEKIELIINDYLKSQFVRELVSGNIVMVKSPIRKTNVILKNPNFQKALELWEFIEQYDVNNKTEKKESNTYEDVKVVKDEMDYSFLLNYLILNSFYKKKDVTPTKIRKYYIDKMIRDFIENNDSFDERKFRKLLMEEFKTIKTQKIRNEKNIIKTVTKEVNQYKNKKESLVKLLVN